ncbi:MAG TPA: ATP-grasp domain-containing protein [Candidatus Eremiobacteraeota bacterium]|nr:MAG: Carbamoyl-phosphate synthase large chain [bacterium ADurb.Bin363]HPZ06808.1 ATP-grasp domain-containing protein [Candidatus Eremiobacteraeota bacterium]
MSGVFVTDGRWHKTLAVVRSLGKKNINVTCGDSTNLCSSFFSRYCNKKILYPSVKKNPKKFIEFLSRELEEKKYSVLFPMEEDTINLITDNLEAFSKDVSIPLVNRETLAIAMNKGELVKFASNSGIPCPKTYFIKDLNDIKAIENKINFPVIIKPTRSSGAKGVKYIEFKKDLEKEYRKIHNIFPYPLIQERIPSGGEAIGVSAIFNQDSNLIASFTHRRIREYPVTGGASTLCESCLRPSITDLAIELLKKLNWFGVAMVEFKVNPGDNTPYLMEINPRFWGSLQLAIYSGVDFPYLLYKIALKEKVIKIKEYKIGTKFRWLIPGDILNFISNPERLKILPDFFNFFEKNITHAIFAWEDPLPILGNILTGLMFIYDKDMRDHLLLKLGMLKTQ